MRHPHHYMTEARYARRRERAKWRYLHWYNEHSGLPKMGIGKDGKFYQLPITP